MKGILRGEVARPEIKGNQVDVLAASSSQKG